MRFGKSVGTLEGKEVRLRFLRLIGRSIVGWLILVAATAFTIGLAIPHARGGRLSSRASA